MIKHIYTKDHPEANGRTPQSGEHAYTFTFPLADGASLEVHMGDESISKFRDFLGSMDIDEAMETT